MFKMFKRLFLIMSCLLSLSSVYALNSIVYFDNGVAEAKRRFNLPLNKLIPDVYYNLNCDLINSSNEEIVFSVANDSTQTSYSWTYLNDEYFTYQTHLKPGSSKLRVRGIVYINNPQYPQHYPKHLVINNGDQTNPIMVQNCYAELRD